MLHHPQTGAPTALTTDASDTAVGAVLEQKQEKHWKHLAFFSRQLRAPERKYATFDGELLGIHLAVRHFCYFLEGREFSIYTDHNPIVAAINKKSEPWSGRQARQLAAISEFTTDIRHISGKDNIVADTLVRFFWAAKLGGQFFAACRNFTTGCKLIKAILGLKIGRFMIHRK